VETKYRPGDQGIVSERIISMTWITLMQRVTRFSSGRLRCSWLSRFGFALNPVPSQQPHFDQLRQGHVGQHGHRQDWPIHGRKVGEAER
jgi:hypothetical protein